MSNALGVRLTGKKSENKIYKHHTGFIGGLKEVPITRMRQRRPEDVSCMLLLGSNNRFTAVDDGGRMIVAADGKGREPKVRQNTVLIV